MSLIDQGAKNLKALGFGAALPTERDQLLGALTNNAGQEQDVNKRNKRLATQGIYKNGGKVAKVRGHGCEKRGKTKGRFV